MTSIWLSGSVVSWLLLQFVRQPATSLPDGQYGLSTPSCSYHQLTQLFICTWYFTTLKNISARFDSYHMNKIQKKVILDKESMINSKIIALKEITGMAIH